MEPTKNIIRYCYAITSAHICKGIHLVLLQLIDYFLKWRQIFQIKPNWVFLYVLYDIVVFFQNSKLSNLYNDQNEAFGHE